jgi:LysM repeat protein
MELRSMNQLLVGFLVAFFSVTIVLGSFVLTQAESKPRPILVTSPSSPLHPLITIVTPAPEVLGNPVTTLASSSSSQDIPFCPVPAGWQEVSVNVGDTLNEFAVAYQISIEELEKANCLVALNLIPGTSLYVPPALPKTVSATPPITSTQDKRSIPTNTKEKASCGPPLSWVLYTVKSGDTLYKLSQMFQVSIAQLQEANCLGTSTLLKGGQQLYVPNVPPLQPSKTTKPTQKPPTSEPPATESPVVPGTDEPIYTESNE